ncbi:hypothetical protein [Pedobacter sp. UBA5917]|jgi:uncharacterized repeat protein (TIGR03806 family)|uniref:hypothetical protein n=1 Tax=Pedobacter sp. UBA5917 TaxID=1947061 RepID=UPI0025E08ABD|nr:hypothetical protein [Pedobacter sp. UBA5917]
MKKKHLVFAVLITFGIAVGVLNACNKDDLKGITNESVSFQPRLSDYHIFSGNQRDLIPVEDYHLYSLATQLFTDYAEKQRLIKIPQGTKLTKVDDGLPEFPDNTIIVKTFYYHHDKRNVNLGKRIIETRLLIKSKGIWNVATYLWNADQTDATLLEGGTNTAVNWITETGEKKVIDYHVPNKRECATCHNSDDQIIPIGPKLRNLNFDVAVNGQATNQLKSFQNLGLLNSFDSHAVKSLPVAFSPNVSLEESARAYLEMNCAHCHNPTGDAKKTDLFLQYVLPIDQTGIRKKGDKIVSKTQKGVMPLLGTTIIHMEGIQLIKDYIESLK